MKDGCTDALMLIWLSFALVMNNLKRIIYYYFGSTQEIENLTKDWCQTHSTSLWDKGDGQWLDD
jgi:hypothetical protein